MKTLIGPFAQALPMDNLPLKGALDDAQLGIVEQAGVLTENGRILQTGTFEELKAGADKIEEIDSPMVLLPGFLDAHTHICFAGSRSQDYAMRVAGKPYLEIAKAGGGIQSTVDKTRCASLEELAAGVSDRALRHLLHGVTTAEVKSGYGLSLEDELKMLRAVRLAGSRSGLDLVPTCLAAHTRPKDFKGNNSVYLDFVVRKILPKVKSENLAGRVDIFTEETAFTVEESRKYLLKARELGFRLTVHGDQFTAGGSTLAAEIGADSVDHLENSGEEEIVRLADSDTVAVALPGASLGLGMDYAPARRLLDAGACVAIASDWNPGSAPMGHLLLQASVLGAAQKLSAAETLAGLTYRAAFALRLDDRGVLASGKLADMQAYPCSDFREILYQQGMLLPERVWKRGFRVK
ncbi:MAG: imidazolonepropionase [Cytophagales bacterium]|nr:imidazolonepropionase [Cytophagales bacterium]